MNTGVPRQQTRSEPDAISTLQAKLNFMARLLSATEISHLMANGRTYRSTVTVRAQRAQEDSEWTTRRGDVLRARAGDWWISDGEDRWSVANEIFERTYVNVRGDEFRKSAAVTAVSMDEPFTVETREGSASGTPGDWLVRNPSGECWPVPAEVFARRYEEA